jgi:ribose transport system substrate-binding protein
VKYSLKKNLSLVTATAIVALGCSASLALAADVPSWCGSKKATIALLDGFGGNSWRQVTTAAG